MNFIFNNYLRIVFFLIATSCLASTDNESKIRFSGIPAIGFGPDSGIGGGLVGSMYVDQDDFLPYKMALGLKFFLTTKGMHSHELSLDQVRAFGLPLRLTTRIGFFSTLQQNYCGLGGAVDCNVTRAEADAANMNFSNDDARDTFIRRYYKNRFMSFFGDVFSRWLLWRDQAKFEFMANYRGRYYLSGDFKTKGPYPGSLYEQDFRNQKTDGYLSTAEIGLMLDKRDNEPAPTSGYWLEGTVRGASWLLGSAWDYFGANLAGRFYVPFDSEHRIVFASQTIADLIVGDLPLDAMSRIGGSQSLYDFNAIGGQYIGRGIREARYVGRIKGIQQVELRAHVASFTLFNQNFDFVPATFADFGMTALDFSRFTKEIGNVHVGFGGALRLLWNRTFTIRADIGVSPSENFSPQLYLVAGNVF